MPLERLKGIVFGVDGTLAETELQGHLPACNEAFRILGYPVQWTPEQFYELQAVPGNRHRMRMAIEELDPPMAPDAIEAAVKELFALKQRLYIEKYLPNIPLRPGVRERIAEAVENGVRLSVVTTSDEPQVLALLDARLPEFKHCFNPVLGKLAGVKTAPGAPLHKRCLAEMGTTPRTTLAIEDMEEGLKAARRAGIPCAVFYNSFTFGQGFEGAALVARSIRHFTLEQLETLCLRND